MIEAVTIEDIRDARTRIAGRVLTTPLQEAPLLNKLAGRRILIKPECLQPIGAFKIRGAWSALLALPAEVRQKGVLGISSGNHAQAVAHAAAQLGVPAVIVMPEDAPAIKIENTRALGAEVVLYDRAGGVDRNAVGEAVANERGLSIIQPFDNAMVIAGQGTCGLEIAEQAAAMGINSADVLVPCGGGGLTAGVALALAADAPDFRVIPVEPELADDVIQSQLAGQRQTLPAVPKSICDAIVTTAPGELTFPIIKRLCAPGIAVSDAEALQAVAIALTRLKLVAEPGGAVALAAALFHADKLENDTIICVLSGGNADPATLQHALAQTTDLP